MEILRPTLINIKGRVYRKNFVQEDNYEVEEEEDFSYMGPPGRFASVYVSFVSLWHCGHVICNYLYIKHLLYF